MAQAVLYPRQYRLEYLTSDGRTGPLHVYAIDVRNDLAVVAAEDLELPALRLRTEIPAQGERAWSIGFPLNLGLTITEGVANGLVESSIEQRIHYTGAINGGMFRRNPQLPVSNPVITIGVDSIDVRPALKAAAEAGESLYFQKDWHFNERGNAVFATALKTEIDARGPADVGTLPRSRGRDAACAVPGRSVDGRWHDGGSDS